ncbi:MAG: LacI family DNA-binding transcriptional regulator [Acidimicrobiia bacterium]|nr:LacI family DNA-binding transcriptional regulator [Acidimicrobiia bacterium]
MATIIDVAKRAGVAVTTVSRVLNEKGQVKEETRNRVLTAIDELAYRPSPAARSLPRRRVHAVSVLVPFVTHPSAVARVQGIVHGLRDTDLPVTILDVEKPAHQSEHFDTLSSSFRPEGAIIVSLVPSQAQLSRFVDAGLCPVFLDADVPEFSRIFVDDHKGGVLGTQHLLDLGHTRIAFIGDMENETFGFESSGQRHKGYRDALRAAGVEPEPEYQRTGPHGRDTGRMLAHELLALPRPPTAVFASSDTQAIGVMEAAREVGLRIPHDMSVVGFDDIEIAAYLGLTTVRHPLYESGLLAAELVIQHIKDPECAPQSVEQKLEVIVRSTTGRPRA